MTSNDFLIELLTEELPPLALKKLSDAFASNIAAGLKKAALTFNSLHAYATPRRLAVLVAGLTNRQRDSEIERRGPAVSLAFDADGQPTKAALGFAGSCGIDIKDASTLKTDKGEWLFCKIKQVGDETVNLLPEIIAKALTQLPIPKLMRWGRGECTFARPVHNVLALYGEQIVPMSLFGLTANNHTVGHRFHHPEKIVIAQPNEYAEQLRKAFVIVDFKKRRDNIKSQLDEMAQTQDASVFSSPALLDEVAAIVEWPVAVLGHFDDQFLSVPEEVLMLSMQTHQKYFPLKDNNHRLLARFITISNIVSKDPDRIADGNRRVLSARFSDAVFFFERDQQKTLESRIDALKSVIFERRLGSLFDKTQRIKSIAETIAQSIQADIAQTGRAADLSKTDLITQMVGEFPKLQGTMGRYYALLDGEPQVVADALDEQYRPRFSGDDLPKQPVGQALALAERIDTLVGIIGLKKIPTGDKDPFGLRRAALGIIRILIEKSLDLDIVSLIQVAIEAYGDRLPNKKTAEQVVAFLQDRLKYWLLEQNIAVEIYESVANVGVSNFLDFNYRVHAVKRFSTQQESASLISANKRVANLLKKQAGETLPSTIDATLFEEAAEETLAKAITSKRKEIETLVERRDYQSALNVLSTFREPVDLFFNHVMVMVDDQSIRQNRLAILMQLRQLFLLVADISQLQSIS
jgi:glycyl-tRNA synthetase beta chain